MLIFFSSQLAVEAPTTRVALITFSDEVKLLGDGVQPEVTVTGDRLFDFAQLKTIAGEFQVKTPVRESKEGLLKKLWALEEGGQTALGPALACSIFVAAQSAGSSVLLATDGLANKVRTALCRGPEWGSAIVRVSGRWRTLQTRRPPPCFTRKWASRAASTASPCRLCR